MGGIGSGRPSGTGMWRDKCHDYLSIDLAWLRKQGCLRPGRRGELTWSRGGQQVGNIQYRVEASGLRLIYRTRPYGGEWSSVNELISFDYTQTNFSGRRAWFQCPSCRQRCRILYGGSRFRCRNCHGLVYETQYEPPFARAATRALKIRKRLGGNGGIDDFFPEKPKGMHWKTYDRLRQEDEQLRNAWVAGISAKWTLFGGIEEQP
jgi:hypothetical protein